HQHWLLQQPADDQPIWIDQRRSDDGCVDLLIPQLFNEFAPGALFEPQGDLRKRIAECTNNARYKRMKRTCGRDSDADSPLLAARSTSCGFSRVAELIQYRTGIFEVGATGVGQLDTARLAAE